jgi:hypothetical protein
MSLRRAWPALPAALLLGACGSAGTSTMTPPAHASPRTVAPGPMLTGTVKTFEDTTFTSTFRVAALVMLNGAPSTAAPSTTCTAYAGGSNGGFIAPQFNVNRSNTTVYFQGMVSQGYGGPGAYDSATNKSLHGTVGVGLNTGPGQAATYSIFRSQIGGSSQVTVHADGSGTFTFSEWGSDEVRGNTGSASAISGTVTWTCG